MHFGRGDSVWVWCVCMCNVMFPSCIFCQQVQTVVSTYLTGVRKNGGAFHIRAIPNYGEWAHPCRGDAVAVADVVDCQEQVRHASMYFVLYIGI